MPFLLGVTNLILHGIDTPNFEHKNSFSDNVLEYRKNDKVSVILMNPPFGSKSEDASIQMNFPKEFQTSETADLFMALIMYRLKANGRVRFDTAGWILVRRSIEATPEREAVA